MTRRLRAAVLVVCVLAAGSAFAQRAPGGPMRVVLLVDSSSTMSPMLTPFRAALNDFLDTLPGDPEIAIASTGGQLRIREKPTMDRKRLHATASSFTSDGGANAFLDSLLEVDARLFRSAPDRRPILVILTSDSGSTRSEVRLDAYNRFADNFLARGGRAHAIIVRGINSGHTTTIAENLVENSGGFHETVGIATAVPKLMRLVADFIAADQ
jgi:hypothetical protein